MGTEEGQHESVVLGEVRFSLSAVQRDGDGGCGGPLETLDHEGHLVLDARAPIVLVVDAEAVEFLDGEEVGELPRRAVARAQVVGDDRLLVLILADDQLEVRHGSLDRLHDVADPGGSAVDLVVGAEGGGHNPA